jgi:hypothetical protein
MGLRSDRILIQTLTAQGVGTVNSNWFDLGSYKAGAFYLVVTAGTGTWTPTFQTSPDNGNTVGPSVATAEMAAPAAVTGVGNARYPFILPMTVPWMRVQSVITVAAVTGVVYFIGRS